MEQIEIAIMDSPIGPIGLAASEKGLLRIELRCPPEEAFAAEIEKRYKAKAVKSIKRGTLKEAERQIIEYLRGKRDKFELALDLRGSEFTVKVLKTMAKIPYGRTWTYGELAGRAGRPKAARAVGRAAGANPMPLIFPCHRVIGHGGKLTGFGSGLDLKAHLLDMEKTIGRR